MRSDKALAVAAAGAMGLLLVLALRASSLLQSRVETYLARSFEAIPFGFWGLLAGTVLGVLLAAAAAARGFGARGYLPLAVAGVLLAGFGWSNLDWLEFYAGRDLPHGGVPDVPAMLPALALLAGALLLAQVAAWKRAEARYLEKGVDPREALAARRLTAASLGGLGVAAVASGGVTFAFHAAATQGAALPLEAPLAALAYPLAAVLGLAGLCALALRGRRGAQRAA